MLSFLVTVGLILAVIYLTGVVITAFLLYLFTGALQKWVPSFSSVRWFLVIVGSFVWPILIYRWLFDD